MAEVLDALDPIIKSLLKQITTILDKKSMDLVVVGGKALNIYFEGKDVLKTHDYDLRLTHKDVEIAISVDDERFRDLEKNRDLTFIYLLKQLNRLILETKIPELLRKKGIDMLFFDDEKTMYFYEDISAEALRFRKSIVYLFTREGDVTTYQETLIDYVIYTPAHFTQYLDFVKIAKEPIPYVTIFGVKYATIPFVLWDTLRMIRYTESRKNIEKHERYMNKYDEIVRALEDGEIRCDGVNSYVSSSCRENADETDALIEKAIPNQELVDKLSCSSLSKLAAKCTETFTCTIKGRELSPLELVEFGVELGLWPETQQWRQRMLSEFSDRYLCDTVARQS